MSNYNNNNNKQQQHQGTPSKTSLRELSEFHPRLSMRAAVSNKINEEALNSIQLQQQQQQQQYPLIPRSPTNNENQGNDLIQNLTRFVGPDGLLKDNIDLKGYAELMQCEVSSSHQILLLKILVATLKNDSSISAKMIECDPLLVVLGSSLIAIDQDKLLESVVVEKILEILLRLNFTVDLLVKYKFGRVIKKITQQKEKTSIKNKTTCLNFEMATKLFDSWSDLASKSEIPNVPRRKSEEEETLNEPIKRPETPPTSMKRPSAIVISDDVAEEKKIKLSEARRRSVRFPDTPGELCKVILFERAPEEYEYLSDGSAARDNYLHADAGEASRAFGTSMESEDYTDFNLKPWKELEIVEGIQNEKPDGMDSEEKIIQHQRERSVLSVNYYSMSDIPPTPSEADVDTAAAEDSFPAKTIPIRPNEKIIQQKVAIKQKTPSLDVQKMFSPDLFNNFITNNSSFNSLLNPFASSSSHDPSRDTKTTSSIWPRGNDSRNDAHLYNPSKNAASFVARKAMPATPSSPREPEYRGYSAKSVCNYYRPVLICQVHPPCRAVRTLMIGKQHRLWHKFKNSCVIYCEYSKLALNEVSSESLADLERLRNLRNIGISAHIDSGKTTLTERILFYTGRIKAIHEVRGKDGVGAKMDSMELEREKGITIKSAATYCHWKSNRINIIDTPGHVDFTIEVERALRVLDSAVLVLCGVSGVQSQTITVDRQMRRYNVPRIAFINKLDRMGANPFPVIEKLGTKLKHNAAALQIPVGTESNLSGLIDLTTQKCLMFSGDYGEKISEVDIPDNLKEMVRIKRQELLEALANVDDEMAEHLLNETFPKTEEIKAAIRRCTINRTFLPVMMGSAYKNVGVQLLLDGVAEYLPNPTEVDNTAIEITSGEKKILPSRSNEPFVGLAFKLEEGRFGQLTYMRVYQGKLSRGSWIHNVVSNKKVKVPRLVRMHSDEMEDVEEVGAGEICAMFGVECSSGDTFTDGTINVSMTPMHVPDPVISLSIKPVSKDQTGNFSKALARFQKEDPTFRVHIDAESGETIISGMGELHLEIYVERMKREYNCPCTTGKPQVAFRETIQNRAEFNFTHKKQSGGAGQFARVAGYIEPIRSFEEDASEAENSSSVFSNEFVSKVVGGAVPTEFIPACEKGFLEAASKGFLVGHPFVGVRYVLEDGTSHVVDSNEHSFRTASGAGFRKACEQARPVILEPIMKVSVMCPIEFQGSVMGNLNKRRALILDSETQEDTLVMTAEVPLNAMFGYSTDLRSLTQGKGEFTMEYKTHRPVMPNIQGELVEQYKKNNINEKK